MTDIPTTLESYRHADLETRLYMILEHRDLRYIFDLIETEEVAAEPAPGVFSEWRDCAFAPLRRLFRRCCFRGV